MRALLLGFALVISGCASARPEALSCVAERAVYANRAQPNAELRIFKPPHAQNAASDLAARVAFEGETYWFAFTASNGYSHNYVGRTGDMIEAARREDAAEDDGEEHQEPEYDGSEIVFFDPDYNVLENIPQSGEPAPAHIIATGIGSAIWYSEPRRLVPIAMWDLKSCADG